MQRPPDMVLLLNYVRRPFFDFENKIVYELYTTDFNYKKFGVDIEDSGKVLELGESNSYGFALRS